MEPEAPGTGSGNKDSKPRPEADRVETSGGAEEAGRGDETETPDTAAPSKAIVDGVTDIISAALGVGASVARAFAKATASEREVGASPSDRPLDEMVHFGVAGITNVVRLVGSAVGDAVDREGEVPDREPARRSARGRGREANATAGSVPGVARGDTLRVPLSVENPGPEPMQGMAVSVGDVATAELGSGKPLQPSAVRCVPPSLDIAPRDFEKLTVFVETEPDTAAGRYWVDVHIGTEAHRAQLHFVVTEASPSEGPRG